MIEMLFKWYFVPPLIVVAVSTYLYGRNQNWKFGKVLLVTILTVAASYFGMVVGENILKI